MSVARNQVEAALSPPLPKDIVTRLLDEYTAIKQHLALRHFQPSEMNGGRFAECVVRLIQHQHNGNPTPFGQYLGSGIAEQLSRQIASNSRLSHSMRTLIPQFTATLYEVRNKRDVGHVGGDVNPNLADSLLVARLADWIMTEILRIYYRCDIATAQKIADSLNETQIPIVAEVDGFVRVLNTALDHAQRTLVILYYKRPSKVQDNDLVKWTAHTHSTRFKKDVLGKLHSDALIHYAAGFCTLLDKGVIYTEKNNLMQMVV